MGSILTVLFVIGLITMGSFSKVRKAIKEFDESAKSPAAPQQHSNAAKEQPSDYFTYESVEPVSSNSFHFSVESPVLKHDSDNLEELVSFDLRQAVIYQTILQNDYIADLK